jgi:hypothetical protein
MTTINIEKLITVNFNCPNCNSHSMVKAFGCDGPSRSLMNRFPSYVQCYSCDKYLAIYSEPSSVNVTIKLMDKKDQEWIENIIFRSADTNTPLLIWKTKCKMS